ncbi:MULTISPECIES: UDP-N-acetylmuramoyl-L-alanine--D-glutamate ligase [unclassified Acidocella]|uniref:UDP-N-acetylmuramoyl-L-alanine--D-glutamate ligase n=1 Tax=unclassified Acidocella TaxID=2648610 RepID=UPI00028C4A5F|nr:MULTISPECIES: UDP-N-acetylmuramoyl-L-alanine--D-glutamate ligase [unclassified Acidocella]EKN00087.1 UDP-N-acetylmuramoyl-L-alanyl-D-glutamate synthetase [Acidocella sp. MX-AZ02]WBO59662.1 UDP-N-acetylmuramoyl-L-alanine--D-glutamate ligase [Acidocella sp. MX-AZ03]
MSLFSGKSYAVVGLGRAGLPAARRLRDLGADVLVWDDGEAARQAAAAEGLAVGQPSESGRRFDALVLSPGIPHRLPKPHPQAAWALAQGIPVLTDAELLYQAVRASGSKARFAGITGTNGKSTTTALLAHILHVAGIPTEAGANLGPAALSLPILPDDGVYVLEMSSYMLERLASLRFDVAVMLNLSPDHLDRHGDMAGYAAAKREIFARQDETCLAVIGMDDAPSREMAAWLRTRPAKLLEISGKGQDTGAPALRGEHNAQNALAAAALAMGLGVPQAAIAEGIISFPGLPHRAQLVAERDGVRFINDSKATNADATARAMGVYERFVWIAGGIGKEGGIEDLAPLFPRIEKAYLIGRDGPEFAARLNAAGIPNEFVETLDRAVPAAYATAKAGSGIVLFSPATASFDQFPNFELRGARFTALAKGEA